MVPYMLSSDGNEGKREGSLILEAQSDLERSIGGRDLFVRSVDRDVACNFKPMAGVLWT